MRRPARPPVRFVRAVHAAAFCLILSACVELPTLHTTPPRLYVLSAKSTYPENVPKVRWQLLVDNPRAPAALATTRIAVYDGPVELRYFEDANWTDFAPRMIQNLLIETFEDSGRIVSVGPQQIGLRADFILQIELREFQAEYEERIADGTTKLGPDAPPPVVRVRLSVKLVKMPQREIVATETFEQRVQVKTNRMSEIIAAFDEALGNVLQSTVAWTLQTGEKHKPRPTRTRS